jgi:hypothetical protein
MLPAAVVLFELGQHIGGVPVAGSSQPPKLSKVTLFTGGFHQLVQRVPAAAISQTTQFVQVPALGGILHEFVDGVRVTGGGTLPQCFKFRVRCLHASTMGAASVDVQTTGSQ